MFSGSSFRQKFFFSDVAHFYLYRNVNKLSFGIWDWTIIVKSLKNECISKGINCIAAFSSASQSVIIQAICLQSIVGGFCTCHSSSFNTNLKIRTSIECGSKNDATCHVAGEIMTSFAEKFQKYLISKRFGLFGLVDFAQ